MKMFSGILVLVAAMALPGLVHADAKSEIAQIEAGLKACLDNAPSNMDMKACQYDALRIADALLNKTYSAIVSGLKAESNEYNDEILKRLVAAEVAWIKFRDTECELQATNMLGGSGESLIRGGCLYEMTNERTQSLDNLLGTGKMR